MAVSRKKIKRIRILALLAVILVVSLLFFSVSAISNGIQRGLMELPDLPGSTAYRVSDTDAADPAGFSEQNPLPEYDKAAENEQLILYLSKDCSEVKLYDKLTGFVWSSRPAKEVIDSEASDSYKKAMESLFNFTYVELSNSATKMVLNTGYSSTEACEVSKERIFGGVRLNYNFTELNIKLGLDIVLDGYNLAVGIQDKNIYENEEAVDTVAQVKKEFEQEINDIRSACEKVNNAIARDSSFSESKRKSIDLKTKATLGILVELKNQTGTGNLKPSQISLIYDNIDYVIREIKEKTDLVKELEEIRKRSDALLEQAEVISQNKMTGIVSLSVMPYFGAQTAGVDGYALYPDGAGAISYFNKNHPSMSGALEVYAYTEHQEIPETGKNDDRVSFPVYGIKAGENAFLAVATQGDKDFCIHYNPCKTDYPVSNIYGSYTFRKSTTLVSATGEHTYVYDAYRTKNDWETRYQFLNGENADYSGMAVSYREYLEQTGQLVRSKLLDQTQIPLSLTFFMGAYAENAGLFRQYIEMTRFSDIQAFSERLLAQGIRNQYLTSINWSEDYGIKRPWSLTPKDSKSDLKELAGYARENGLLFSLEYENLWIEPKDVSNAEANIATVKAKSQLTRTLGSARALNPAYIYNSFLKNDLKTLQDYGLTGLYLFGPTTLYYDYNKNAVVDRAQTAGIWQKLCSEVQSQIGSVVMDQPNAYNLATTDFASELAHEDSGYLFTDECVPFAQMVLHGSIAYTGPDFNYFYDETQQKLKLVEYGYSPAYLLTQEETVKLRNHGINGFFSTVMSDWEKHIIATQKEFDENLSGVWNQKMMSHEKLSDTLSKVVYENGARLYVNYGSEQVQADGITIGPESYHVEA